MSNYTTRKKINHKGAEGARRKEESALAVSFVRLGGLYSSPRLFCLYQTI
jgi:hypothetical protein